MLNYTISDNTGQIITEISRPVQLNQSALTDLAEIIRLSIENNLSRGKSFDGSSIAPKKKGGRIFVETGELLNSVEKKVSTSMAEVFINSNRSQIASWLQDGTSKMPARRFFGISSTVDSEIDRYLENIKIENLQ